jgi:hypothetical protein
MNTIKKNERWFLKYHQGLFRRLDDAGVTEGAHQRALLELLCFWNGRADGLMFPGVKTLGQKPA